MFSGVGMVVFWWRMVCGCKAYWRVCVVVGMRLMVTGIDSVFGDQVIWVVGVRLSKWLFGDTGCSVWYCPLIQWYMVLYVLLAAYDCRRGRRVWSWGIHCCGLRLLWSCSLMRRI